MEKDFVVVREKKYFVKNGKLDLSNKGITDITEIKGLEKLTNLQTLYLYRNPIKGDEHHLLHKHAQDIVIYCQEKANKDKEGD